MSISQNFSPIKPSLNLDFANTKTLDPRITFSRPTGAVYYDGKSVTKAEENLVKYSQEFDNAVWDKVNVTVTVDSTTAPDGTTTASTLTATATTSIFILGQNSAFGANTTSIYAQNGTADFFQLTYNGDTTSYANFNLSTGVVGTSGGTVTHSITNVGGGWYRLVVVNSSTAVTGITWGIVGSASAIRRQSFTAVGTETVYLWGAQLEQRDTVTAYTPTTTQPITNYIPTLLSAPADTARFDHDPVTGESLGLLVEEQRTNLLLRSEEFDNAAWVKTFSTITANTIVAPDGTLSGDKLVENTSLSDHVIRRDITLTATPHTFSIYSKASERTWVALLLFNNSGVPLTAYFDVQNGVIGTVSAGLVAQIYPVDNGWYRCSITVTSPAVDARSARVYLAQSNTVFSYTGDGYSGIYIWGAQLETGSFPTSYIKTEASQVTRSADSASMVGSNFSEWFNPAQGSVYVEAQPASRPDLDSSSTGTTLTAVSFGNAIANQYSVLARTEAGSRVNRAAAYFRSPIVVSAPETANNDAYPNGSFTKFATAMKPYDYAFSANGGSIVASNTPDTVIGTRLNIGGNYQGTQLNGTIKKISYYPTRLSNLQLQSLTS